MKSNKDKIIMSKNLKEKIKHLPCPACLKKNGENIGYEISTVVSYLIYCDDKTEIKITCKDCARKFKLNAILKTFFLGWWSKRGILSTPFTLIKELINFLFYKEKISNRIIDTFIDKNNGQRPEKECFVSKHSKEQKDTCG